MTKFVWIFIIVSVLSNAVHFLVHIDFLKPMNFLYKENGPFESLTAALFILTFLLGRSLLRNPKMKEKITRRWIFFLLIIGLLGFLEEISFGQVWIHYTRPKIDGMKIDAIHDFIGLGYKRGGWYMLYIWIPFSLTMAAVYKYRKEIWECVSVKRYHSLYLLMSFFTVLIAATIIVDLELLNLPPGMRNSLVEEFLEFNAALALLLSLYCIYKIPLPDKPLSQPK